MTPEKRLKSVRNWIAGAEYDLETAKHMLKTKRCGIYVPFGVGKNAEGARGNGRE